MFFAELLGGFDPPPDITTPQERRTVLIGPPAFARAAFVRSAADTMLPYHACPIQDVARG